MTARERCDRNAAIFAARARGFGWTSIAHEHGVSERQAQRIYADHREDQGIEVGRKRAVEEVQDLLAGYDAALEDLARIAHSTRHDGTRLGAIRTRIELLNVKFDLKMATGMIPHDICGVRNEIDGERVAAAIFRVFDRHGVSGEIEDEILQALDGSPESSGEPPTHEHFQLTA